MVSEKATHLHTLLRKPKGSFVYLFDYGYGWEHDVILERIDPLPPGVRAPR